MAWEGTNPLCFTENRLEGETTKQKLENSQEVIPPARDLGTGGEVVSGGWTRGVSAGEAAGAGCWGARGEGGNRTQEKQGEKRGN